MKLKLALATAFLAISTSSVQADTRTPDILSALSSASIQQMTAAEASQARGEYYVARFRLTTYTDRKTGKTTFSVSNKSKKRKIKWRSNYPGGSEKLISKGYVNGKFKTVQDIVEIIPIFKFWRIHVSR